MGVYISLPLDTSQRGNLVKFNEITENKNPFSRIYFILLPLGGLIFTNNVFVPPTLSY